MYIYMLILVYIHDCVAVLCARVYMDATHNKTISKAHMEVGKTEVQPLSLRRALTGDNR